MTTEKTGKNSPNYRFHHFIFDSVTLKIKRESRREVQDPQMSSVVFYGSKLLKAGVRCGNMKLVTIRAVQVRGRETPCS